jgi:hypothetical protein
MLVIWSSLGSGEKNQFCWHFETKFVLLISYYRYINVNKDMSLKSHKRIESMDYFNFICLLVPYGRIFRIQIQIQKSQACGTYGSWTLHKKNVKLSRRGEGREGERREGSVPLEYGSCSFWQWLSKCQHKMIIFSSLFCLYLTIHVGTRKSVFMSLEGHKTLEIMVYLNSTR